MPPEAYFPAALDDLMTVYREALKTTAPKNLAVFGTSAGGALVLELMLQAKQKGIPLPGAIAPGTPMSDITKTGERFTRMRWWITFWYPATDSATPQQLSTHTGTISRTRCSRRFTEICTASRQQS